jgi:hypothetical protein
MFFYGGLIGYLPSQNKQGSWVCFYNNHVVAQISKVGQLIGVFLFHAKGQHSTLCTRRHLRIWVRSFDVCGMITPNASS